MNYSIGLFEDQQVSQLNPLTLTRPVYDLRCGILTLKEKVVRGFPTRPLSLFCRDYLQDLVRQENPNVSVNEINANAGLFINGRWIPPAGFSKIVDGSPKERIFTYKGVAVAAFLTGPRVRQFVDSMRSGSAPAFNETEKYEVEEGHLIDYPWDLVHLNPAEIERDFRSFEKGGEIHGSISANATVVNKDQIYIGKDSTIKPGAVLDAEEGPIFIGEGVTVMANAVIEGPTFIGNHSRIKIGAKIYEGTSIGEVCKVGGEVEESIIHSYSNKQHDGFLGHAYLGQWVNLGADTNNSDLKNNYGSVKVFVDNEWVDSGSMFVGLFMGDHSKTGINSMMNTGTVVGAMCNIYGAGFPPKYIPSFSWGGSEGLTEHNFGKAIETAARVMSRRKRNLTAEYENVFKHIFEVTGKERKARF